MKLRCMVVADPDRSTGELIAEQCERLAGDRIVATSVEDTLDFVRIRQPEILVLSLELRGIAAEEMLPKLSEAAPGIFVLATYRELSVPRMQELSRLGFGDLVPNPVDIVEVFRAASRYFKIPFRRHDRFEVSLEVLRADGVTIGRTVDLSEGGLCMVAGYPAPEVGGSILIDLPLADGEQPLRVRCGVLSAEDAGLDIVSVRLQFTSLRGSGQQRLTRYLQRVPEKATRAS